MKLLFSLPARRIFGSTFQRLFSHAAAGSADLPEERYGVKRGNYAYVNDKDMSFLENLIGTQNVLKDDLEQYNDDFFGTMRGNGKLVIKPKNVEEISAILKYCNERNLAICPQGGNTGLVGGAVPVFDEIILSLQRLDKILSIDATSGVLACEAGCILENLENKAQEVGLTMPLDLGAKSSCQIGGNVSTNAGGLRVIRYGNLHGTILGVEAVLPNGQILNLMSNLKKDNTGYHLKHMFIGSEGTLGVLTKLAILCPPAPSAVHVAFIGLSSYEDVMKTFLNAKRYLGEILSSCELIDEKSLNASVTHFNLNSPIEGYPFYMLIETAGSNAQHDMEKLHNFLENSMEKGEVLDGTITGEVGKVKEIWKLRELIPLGIRKDGYFFMYDISLPLAEFYNIVYAMQKRVGDKALRVCGFGHLGDSNIHLNIACKEYSKEVHDLIEPFVYEHTAKVKGSVSAEHGIGVLKKKYLKHSKSPEAINMMHEIKNLLDSKKILNPYKVLL